MWVEGTDACNCSLRDLLKRILWLESWRTHLVISPWSSTDLKTWVCKDRLDPMFHFIPARVHFVRLYFLLPAASWYFRWRKRRHLPELTYLRMGLNLFSLLLTCGMEMCFLHIPTPPETPAGSGFTARVTIVKSNQTKSNCICNMRRMQPYSEMITYKPLTNNAVLKNTLTNKI